MRDFFVSIDRIERWIEIIEHTKKVAMSVCVFFTRVRISPLCLFTSCCCRDRRSCCDNNFSWFSTEWDLLFIINRVKRLFPSTYRLSFTFSELDTNWLVIESIFFCQFYDWGQRTFPYLKLLIKANAIGMIYELGVNLENRIRELGCTSANLPGLTDVLLSSSIVQETVHNIPSKTHSRFFIGFIARCL